MNILNHIPPVWGDVLDNLQDFCPSALIAGGALRDLYFNSAVKDLDIFVQADEFHPLGAMVAVEHYYGWRPQRCLIAAEYAMGMRSDVQGVYEYTVPRLTIPVQVVVMVRDHTKSFADQVIGRIDFGACQIAFNGSQLFQTSPCILDHLYHRFTLVNCDDATQARRSLRRADKFRERFPLATFDTTLADVVMDLGRANQALAA